MGESKLNESRPKVSIDTNILKQLSTRDWILWIYENYKHMGEKKEQIRKILTLGRSKIRLVISGTAYREFISKNPRDEIAELLNLLFEILPPDEESILIIHELSTSLAKLYSRERESGNPEPDIKDIAIFLESWQVGCNFLLSADKFLKPFQRFLQKEISSINSSQSTKEKEGKIQRLAQYILNESQLPAIIHFLSNLLSFPPPNVIKTADFLEKWEIEESDQDMLVEQLISVQEVMNPNEVTEEVRRAVVNIKDSQEKILLIDELLEKIAPEIFGMDLTPPPYGEELKNILKGIREYLTEMGIKSITLDFGVPEHFVEVFNSGEIRAIWEDNYFDFDFDKSFMWVSNEYGEKDLESMTEINLDTLRTLIEDIESEIRRESERKAKEWKAYYTSRFGRS